MEILLKQLLEKILGELQKEDTKKQVETVIIDPVVIHIGNKLYPYIISAVVFLSIVFMMLIYSVFCLRKLIVV